MRNDRQAQVWRYMTCEGPRPVRKPTVYTTKTVKKMNRYIVFMKQVPQSTKVDIDPETKTLKRASALCRTNPDDLCALQAALNMRKATGAEVVAVSMGPEKAVDVLREALQLGADRAVLISSPAFAGSDTLCTSVALAAAARKIGYSMLFFGRMAVDGDTAQVGPEVAGQLDIPQITHLVSIDSIDDKAVSVTRENGETVQRMRVLMPCALMASREFSVDAPTLAGWRRAQSQEITRWNETDLGIAPDAVGLKASPTKVLETAVIRNEKNTLWIDSGAGFMQALADCMA